MNTLTALIKRNIKLFFKDKGMFFTSLITPLILLVLYMTFLGNVYESTFTASVPQGFSFDDKIIGGVVGGLLVSSLLAVSCVTVAFCSNMLMVQDKVNGAILDITIAPVRSSTMAVGYYVASMVTTLIVCYVAVGAGLIYLACVGFYMTIGDILLVVLDVLLVVMFGTALSSVINYFLSSQGQISAIGTVVGAGYGFICGAYMPISQFGPALQKVLGFLPGTYGTSLIRNHCMRGVFKAMEEQGFPADAVDGIRDSVDCNLYFFGERVGIGAMFAVICASVAVLLLAYILMNVLILKKKK